MQAALESGLPAVGVAACYYGGDCILLYDGGGI